MSELMEHPPQYSAAPYESYDYDGDAFMPSVEVTPETESFQLQPFREEGFPEGRLAAVRAQAATHIKEDLQRYVRLDSNVRHFQEVSTRGEYIWIIISTLGMTKSELRTEAYTNAFEAAHTTALTMNSQEIGDVMDRHEHHPALGFIDTVASITPKDKVTVSELIMLRRSLLVLLDTASPAH